MISAHSERALARGNLQSGFTRSGQEVGSWSTTARDALDGLLNWRMWGRLGWAETRRRYRRTVVGPFWTSISLALFVIPIGLLYTAMWKNDPKEYLPFLTSGMISWVLISCIVTEGCDTFVANGPLLTQIRMNVAVLAATTVWRNFLVFFHNMLGYVAVALFVGGAINVNTLLVIPGLFIIFVNAVWVCLLFGLLCARYRDVAQVIGSLLQISMFLTPIFWTPAQLEGRGGMILINFNPLYHFVEAIRAPLLGKAPALLTYTILASFAALGWVATIAALRRYRRDVPFWV